MAPVGESVTAPRQDDDDDETVAKDGATTEKRPTVTRVGLGATMKAAGRLAPDDAKRAERDRERARREQLRQLQKRRQFAALAARDRVAALRADVARAENDAAGAFVGPELMDILFRRFEPKGAPRGVERRRPPVTRLCLPPQASPKRMCGDSRRSTTRRVSLISLEKSRLEL